MYPSLREKVAVVSGAARGIGRVIAQRLAAEGCRVALADMDGDAAAAAAVEIGDEAVPVRADVSQSAQVRAMAQAVVERWRRIDILVNNAGVVRPGPLETFSESDWDLTMAVNLRGAFLCAQAALPHMPDGGRIINIGSNSGLRASAGLGAYSVSKFGIVGLTQALALEVGSRGITVNAVCPGDVFEAGSWSEELYRITREKLGVASDEEVRRIFRQRTALGADITAEDVAQTVAFLASDQAAHITGQAIPVNAGKIMR
jgi:NAD(P)-dependent dehydrogenase (short-subunit alcohol dehydrogenase family)